MTYAEAKETIIQSPVIEDRLEAHALILKLDACGTVGSAIVIENQSSALGDIAQALSFILRNTVW